MKLLLDSGNPRVPVRDEDLTCPFRPGVRFKDTQRQGFFSNVTSP
ncbi:hypothetical protein CSUI_001279 [Cystoisospora suis]|uniref:Uncharacterized protein n=1 Tax=Cystoisospora suis TaxID=483139 RepID=A0A2C6LD55_9APIC|nr:hypothetical protein CSUI_001279 [Cystoisospora suis]